MGEKGEEGKEEGESGEREGEGQTEGKKRKGCDFFYILGAERKGSYGNSAYFVIQIVVLLFRG